MYEIPKSLILTVSSAVNNKLSLFKNKIKKKLIINLKKKRIQFLIYLICISKIFLDTWLNITVNNFLIMTYLLINYKNIKLIIDINKFFLS